MILKNFNKITTNYLLLTLSLILTYWFISVFEITSLVSKGNEIESIFTVIGFKFLNHLFTGVLIALVFLPFYLFLNKGKRKIGTVLIKIIFIIFIVIEFSLTKYSLVTLLNLGADLLGYSLDDITTTATSSESASLLSFVTFIVFPLLFLVTFYFIKKIKSHKLLLRIFLFIIAITFLLKFFYSGFSETNYQNKTYYFITDVVKNKMNKTVVNVADFKGKKEFPFLRPTSEFKDVLTPFFNIKEEKPNIVFIIVEGLGTEFIGEEYYGGFTPYLETLIPKSIFLENFLSNAGRTFGALPSILGSLPFAEKGFLEIPETPNHVSLYSILKNNGYTTSFYSGDRTSFDKKINFLEFNGVDIIVDENMYDSSYPKTVNASTGFSWGYSDNEIFKKTLSDLDASKSPRLDIITTQTIHAPFTFPTQDIYLVKVDSVLNANKNIKVTKKEVEASKDIFASILYADHSIEKFMKAYEKREEFKNTIFIITGDHRLIPISQKDKLCRFNVPLFIYSPMLNRPKRIKSISSHFDLTPTVLSFLSKNYNVTLPDKVAWLGDGIDTVKSFRNIHKIPLMRSKGGLNDYIYKDYLFSEGDLYKINNNFNIHKINDEKLKDEISKSFDKFKELNAYTTQNNKIFPNDSSMIFVKKYQFTPREVVVIDSLSKNLELNEIFLLAREKAFNNEREIARLLCNYILSKEPNYVDVKILKGRSFAWDKRYRESEEELLDAIKRSPYYYDAYLALLDVYWWSSQTEKPIFIFDRAKANKIENDDIAFKMARAYLSMNNKNKANQLMDSILLKSPKNMEYIKLKNSIK